MNLNTNIDMTDGGIYEVMNDTADRFFRVGAGESEIRAALCRCPACPMAHGAVATVEMGVSLAVWRQVVAFRRLQARNSPLGSDRVGECCIGRLSYFVLCNIDSSSNY